MKRTRPLLVGLLSLALLATACGDGGGEATTTTADSGGEATTTTAAPDVETTTTEVPGEPIHFAVDVATRAGDLAEAGVLVRVVKMRPAGFDRFGRGIEKRQRRDYIF